MSNRLQLFLYLLMRDKLPTGEVVDLINQSEAANRTGIEYSSSFLSCYSKELAERLK